MRHILLSTIVMLSLYADSNITQQENNSSEQNITKKIDKQLQMQMEREKKFANEQRFYQGEDYDLSYAEVDKSSLDSVNLIEPDYDFNMDDVYD